VLRGALVPATAEVRIEIGGAARTCRCVGLADDGFVVESDHPLPLRQLLRCTLRVPDAGELDLFAFAACAPVGARHEMKPMGMSGEVAERWYAMREKLGGAVRARGTGPTRPLKAGVYVSVARSRAGWFGRLLQRFR
jgi:hypothetical protein